MNHTVLIVDDSLTVRMDLADAFKAAGFRPLPCATAAEARDMLSRGSVDVIILDVLLPDANGVDLLNEIRSAPGGSAVSVVCVSGVFAAPDFLLRRRLRRFRFVPCFGAGRFSASAAATSWIVPRFSRASSRTFVARGV